MGLQLEIISISWFGWQTFKFPGVLRRKKSHTLNLGTGRGYTVLEVIKSFENIIGDLFLLNLMSEDKVTLKQVMQIV